MLRIQWYAVDGTYLLALRFVKMSHAFGASRRIDYIDDFALIDGLIGALGFADVAIDTFIGD
jgi:hypothetical protein